MLLYAWALQIPGQTSLLSRYDDTGEWFPILIRNRRLARKEAEKTKTRPVRVSIAITIIKETEEQENG